MLDTDDLLSPLEDDGCSLMSALGNSKDGGRSYIAVPSEVTILPGSGGSNGGGYGALVRSLNGRPEDAGGGVGARGGAEGFTSALDGEDADDRVLTVERSLMVKLRRTELLLLDRLLKG